MWYNMKVWCNPPFSIALKSRAERVSEEFPSSFSVTDQPDNGSLEAEAETIGEVVGKLADSFKQLGSKIDLSLAVCFGVGLMQKPKTNVKTHFTKDTKFDGGFTYYQDSRRLQVSAFDLTTTPTNLYLPYNVSLHK
jgi:hypothetical protein